MVKNKTHKEDKDKYRPWRRQESNYCIGCGRGLKNDSSVCDTCEKKIEEGYEIW